jgi:hypothetical protein
LFVVPAIYVLLARDRKPAEALEMEFTPNGHDQIHPQKEGIRVSVA